MDSCFAEKKKEPHGQIDLQIDSLADRLTAAGKNPSAQDRLAIRELLRTLVFREEEC